MLRFRIEPVTNIGEQRFGVTLHRAQRGAHVVRDAVRKRFQLTDGLLQGNGSFLPLPFKLSDRTAGSLARMWDGSFSSCRLRIKTAAAQISKKHQRFRIA